MGEGTKVAVEAQAELAVLVGVFVQVGVEAKVLCLASW